MKRCYHFGPAVTDGSAADRDLLGGKGANLAEMARIGLPVPPGLTISTETCAEYLRLGRLPPALLREVDEHLARLEGETGKKFGGPGEPLLLSVRSGAAVSMPGMMDTILDLGLNDETVVALANATVDARFAYDAYRRLINMFGDVVMGVGHELFEQAFSRVKRKHGAKQDTDLDARGLEELCRAYKAIYQRRTKSPFPQDPRQQLELAITAVFKSWNGARARKYREIHAITGLLGTAVNVQSMVFGNMGQDSGTGVAFTRNPSTGADELYGEYLVNAQGEDVVAGIRTPRPIAELADEKPALYRELLAIRKTLERHYRDMQDIEFTFERGKLYILQTRTGQRAGSAAVTIAVDMVKQRLIDKKTALATLSPDSITQLLLPSFRAVDKKDKTRLGWGLPASPGAASGKIAFTAAEAVDRAHRGEDVILVRHETSPEDVDGMHHAKAVLTSTGGMTSHAAVVARGWGKCCVVGASELDIDPQRRTVTIGGHTLHADDVISVDGATGELYLGALPTVEPTATEGAFATIMKWADEHARLGVRANADTPEDAQRARDLGAKGIGLCRTEHMFFQGSRIVAMQRMILAETAAARRKALRKLLPMQRRDFARILTAMAGLPVTVRLLDPPLHEFVPHTKSTQDALARQLGVPLRIIERRVRELQEANPMLGHRGCRLAITYPEIVQMQVTAIVEATIACREKKIDARPQIMIPLVGARRELEVLREQTLACIDEVRQAKGYLPKLAIPVGTMIEIPRAALTAGEIAGVADFFSFGTNDLTQLTFGFSRDDVNTFLPDYLQAGILPADPFQQLDRSGVGQLVAMATERGRAAKPHLDVGVCGEHGGDPQSVRFFHDAGLDYVSCSPFRVPIARLVAAQAAIESAHNRPEAIAAQ